MAEPLTQMIWVGFSVEQLSVLADEDKHPLDFSFIFLRKRIKFTRHDGYSGSPSHANYLAGINVNHSKFIEHFGELGRVYSPTSYKLRNSPPADDRSFVLAIVRKALKDDPDVEDIVQESLLQAHRKQDTFQGRSKYHTWLYRIVWNTLVEFKRKSARQLPASNLEWDTEGPDVRNMYQAAQDIKHIPSLELLWDAFAEGMTDTELAHKYKQPQSTIRSKIHRARQKAQEALS
jgi:RNA polymerase sigma-70 factor (ECF subfamily)